MLPWAMSDVVTEYGEDCSYGMLESQLAVSLIPQLLVLYRAIRAPLEALTGQEVLFSQWPRSAININKGVEGSRVGLHHDSNPLTVLLTLTKGAATQMFDEGLANERILIPQPGRAFVFNGKDHPHRVGVGKPGEWRVSVPFCYYHPNDNSRPEGWDEHMYDNKPIGDLYDRITG